MRNALLSVVVAAVLCAGVGCDMFNKKEEGGEAKPMASGQKSLYDRLGGKGAVTAVVNDFVGKAAGDPKVNFTRKGVPGAEWQATDENVKHLKMQLVDFLSMAFGGPNNYKGKTMKASHANMQITSAEFDAIAADLAWALDKNGVPAKEKGEVMTIAASTKKDIVTK